MNGFTPEPLAEVGNRPLEEVEAMLKSGYERITFTSSGGMYYEIGYIDGLNIPFTLTVANTNGTNLLFGDAYRSLEQMLENHPLNLSRFEISN